MAEGKNPNRISVEGAISSTAGAMKTLQEMAWAYRGKTEGERYAKPVEDLRVVLSVLKGYKEDSEKGKPTGPARAALTEACQTAARDLGRINPGLSAAYETLPYRIDEGHRYKQKGESSLGTPEIAIWLISFVIIYGILRNANIF